MKRRELDERWFAEYRRQSLTGKRKMNGDQHRIWDANLAALLGQNPDAVTTVVMSGHTGLRVDPTTDSKAMGVLINLDEVRVLGFARGESHEGSNIWLLDAASSFYFAGSMVKALPRFLPEYSPQPRTRSLESRFEVSGEEMAPVWSDPILLHRESDILGEK